jgi:hypothetical protein
VTGALGQPPTVLALDRRQQTEQEVADGQLRLDPGESDRDPLDGLLEYPPSAGHGYAVAAT